MNGHRQDVRQHLKDSNCPLRILLDQNTKFEEEKAPSQQLMIRNLRGQTNTFFSVWDISNIHGIGNWQEMMGHTPDCRNVADDDQFNPKLLERFFY